MSTQFHPSHKTAQPNSDTVIVDTTGVTPEQTATVMAAVAKAKDEHAKAEREAKAKAIGQNIAGGIIKTGKTASKIGRFAWKGSFDLLKGTLSAVENAPVAVTKAVVNEYKKA